MNLLTQVQTLAAQLGAILADKKLMITTAESCTGGGVSYALTDTSGSSRYLNQAFVTYSNQAKHTLLGVQKQTLKDYGAVSEQTVIQMAQGAAKAAQSDVAIAVSGIAGPTGGSAEKPVGLVWFAVFFKQQIHSESFIFKGSRSEIREQAIQFVLEKTIKIIKST